MTTGNTPDETKSQPGHTHTVAEEKKIREAALDQTIEATFPASDPPSTDPNPDDEEALDRSELGGE